MRPEAAQRYASASASTLSCLIDFTHDSAECCNGKILRLLSRFLCKRHKFCPVLLQGV